MQLDKIVSPGFSRRNFLGLSAGALGSLLLPQHLHAAQKTQSRPPNFIIIFTDDQGYNDLGCFGSEKLETPYIDMMAKNGIKFTDFYVASSVCSPSRAALLTGCYPPRVGINKVLWPNARYGLNPREITIAELLKKGGYATACIGKWHLGDRKPFLPTNNGFDYYFGIPYSNDMRPRKLIRNEEIIEKPVDLKPLTQRYTNESVQFIKKNKDKPFFLYLPHTMPHVPLAVSEEFSDMDMKKYAKVIKEIDWSTGTILKTLKELGIDSNTLVIFTSDNGPWRIKGKKGGSADPLRGGKFTMFEGGFRVPCVMWWPGNAPSGTVCSEITSTIDLYPTMAALAGIPLPDNRLIDGKSIVPLINRPEEAQTPHYAFLFYGRSGKLKAIRSGKWKYHIDRNALFNLRSDIREHNNVADSHRDVIKRLKQIANRMDNDLKANIRPPGFIDTVKAPKE